MPLGGVRVHTDERAAASARAVGALAYTLGDDVVFAARQFAPDTADGRRLLAHELAHVVQGHRPSRADDAAIHRQPVVGGPAPAPPEPSYRVVQRDIGVVGQGQLAAKLGLPPGSVPPGAESNPDFLLSLTGPDGSAARLEELPGAPAEFVASLPDNEVVEVPAHHMPWLTKTLAVEEGAEHAVHEMARRGSERAEAIAHTKVFRNGHRLFKVVDYGYSLHRLVTAPAEQKVEDLTHIDEILSQAGEGLEILVRDLSQLPPVS